MNRTHRKSRLLMALIAALLAVAAAGCLDQILEDSDPKSGPPAETKIPPTAPLPDPGAQTSEPPELAGMLAAHNAWRQRYGVPRLTWSPQLAQYAQAWADRLAAGGCNLQHRSSGPYGENLAWASGTRMTPGQVVDMWGSESRNYDPNSNTCFPGQVCGHFTQIVWANSSEVGCGLARCGDQEVWVCNYNPPGNYIGQRPF